MYARRVIYIRREEIYEMSSGRMARGRRTRRVVTFAYQRDDGSYARSTKRSGSGGRFDLARLHSSRDIYYARTPADRRKSRVRACCAPAGTVRSIYIRVREQLT